MKPIHKALFLLAIAISCKNESQINFEIIEVNEVKCSTCPIVTISIPNALDSKKIDNAINTALQEEIITQLNFDEQIDVNSIEKATLSFKNGYKNLLEKFPEETTKWEANIEGKITYEDKNVISIALTSYLFTGGAHGYSSTRYLNFDKKKGVELENWELFNTEFDFVKFAELKFRIQEKIAQDAAINDTGFMFQNDAFTLSENIAYTKNGLQLLYNPYEIAPFSDGIITLTIPYQEAKKYLNLKLKL